MIVVSGTKRSGTSLWMQILKEMGYKVIGDKFPFDWENTIRSANPNGFYETKLRMGINYESNPIGPFYISHKETKNHAIKIFIPGLAKTDIAYVDKVIFTIRDWKEYRISLKRLYDLEDAYVSSIKDENDRVEKSYEAKKSRTTLPYEVEWFFENYSFLIDYTHRKFDCKVISHESLTIDPKAKIEEVSNWLGFGRVEEGLKAIDPTLVLKKKEITVDGIEYSDFYDEFYHAVSSAKITGTLFKKAESISNELKKKYSVS